MAVEIVDPEMVSPTIEEIMIREADVRNGSLVTDATFAGKSPPVNPRRAGSRTTSLHILPL
jgi:hypothetical protein